MVRGACATTAIPLISPPPPIGVMNVSIAGTSSSISIATVPCAGDDARIVERVDEGIAALGLELAGMGVGRVERLAVQDHRRAVPFGLRRPSPSACWSA